MCDDFHVFEVDMGGVERVCEEVERHSRVGWIIWMLENVCGDHNVLQVDPYMFQVL